MHDASLVVRSSERCVVLGSSGAGKTTLLRLIAGLEQPDSGAISLEGHDITGKPPQLRSVSLLFSQGALFPHLTAFENLAFALLVQRVARAAVRAQVQEVAERLHITPHLWTRAALLSAGERQRVALGRALLRRPRVLLLDEPVAHLDPPLRENVRSSILETAAASNVMVLYVTHDHEDAFSVADRIAVLIEGRLVQVAAPQVVYDFPATLDVARFVGPVPMNLFDAEAHVVGIRAEHITLAQADADLSGVVVGCTLVGASRLLHVRTPRGDARVALTSADVPPRGTTVAMRFTPAYVRRFDRRTGLAIA